MAHKRALYMRSLAEELSASTRVPVARRRASASRSRLPNSLLGPSKPGKVKSEPYESGLPSDVRKSFRFGISFYIDRDAVHPVRHRGGVPLSRRGPPAGVRHRSRSWRSSSSSCCWRWPSRTLEKGCAGLEVTRTKVARLRGGVPRHASSRPSRCCAATWRASDLDEYVEKSAPADPVRGRAELGSQERDLPAGLRPGLLRDRDDQRDRLAAQRPGPLRRRGDPLLPAPGRHADPVRPRVDQDGARSSGASTTRCWSPSG